LPPGRLARCFVAAAIAVLAAAAPAGAYVRTRGSKGAPLYWDRTILDITAYVGEPPAPLTSADIVRAVRGAAAAWSRRAVGCTSIELRVATDPAADAPVVADGKSRLVFRRDEWCKQPREPDEPCYDGSILAVTSVFAHPSTGKIVDADVEVNAVGFSWTDRTGFVSADALDAHDLQNALTHELGHLIGFDHTCSLGNDDRPLIDDHGADAPSCFEASPAQADSTMYPSVQPPDLDRRTLSPDDKRGLCAVYPAFETEVDGAPAAVGCTIAPGTHGRGDPGASVWLAGLVAALGARVRARRTSRRARATRPSTGRSPGWPGVENPGAR
jgi:hypothetical protein